ncbi:hypothetical protein ACFL59_09210 [Planctomycetota bacterium]
MKRLKLSRSSVQQLVTSLPVTAKYKERGRWLVRGGFVHQLEDEEQREKLSRKVKKRRKTKAVAALEPLLEPLEARLAAIEAHLAELVSLVREGRVVESQAALRGSGRSKGKARERTRKTKR